MNRLPKIPAMLTEAFGALAVRGLGIVLMFSSTTLFARVLGPEEFGTYSAALATAMLLATLAPLGTDRVLVRNISNSQDDTDTGSEIAIAHACTAVVSLLIFIMALALAALAHWGLHNAAWSRAALLAAVLFPPLTVIYLRQWVAIPLLGTRRAVILEQTVLPFATTATVLAAFGVGATLRSGELALIYATVMASVWWLSLQNTTIHNFYRLAWKQKSQINSREVRNRITVGLPFVSVAIGAVLTQSCMPVVIAAACGFSAAGFFALAAPYAALAAVPLGIFNLSMVSRCSRHFERGEHDQAYHAVRSASTATFVSSVVIAGVIWFLVPWLTLILGHDYGPVRMVLPPLLLASVVDSLTGPTLPVMQTMNLEKSHARWMLVFVPIQLALIYFFSAKMDVEGAAVGYLLARCLWNVIVVKDIYSKRGLLMLPYLSLLRAVREPAVSSGRLLPHAVLVSATLPEANGRSDSIVRAA